MKVFVTGGTGAIGRHAVKALVRGGHEVSALCRSERNREQLSGQGARPVVVSLFDRAGLATAFMGHDAVVNLATAQPATADFAKGNAWAETLRVRSEGSAAVVDAALVAGVRRLVQESVSMIYRPGGSTWIDETWPTDDYPTARGNHAAETSARRFTQAGGVGIVLRLGWFYGPHATHSEEFLTLARRWRICIGLGLPDTYVSSIHVADGGQAVVAALTAPAGVYNVVDDEPLTKRAYAGAIAAAAGLKHYLRAPGTLALLLGDRTTPLTRSLRVSNEHFKRTTGWSPAYPSSRDGWLAMAAGGSVEL